MRLIPHFASHEREEIGNLPIIVEVKELQNGGQKPIMKNLFYLKMPLCTTTIHFSCLWKLRDLDVSSL